MTNNLAFPPARTLLGGAKAALLALGLMLTTTLSAGAVDFAGTLDVADPVFNRPLTGTPPTGLSSVGTAVFYDNDLSLFSGFTVSLSGSYTFALNAIVASAPDTFAVLYQGSFNPASPLTNALVADDDSGTGVNSLFTATLTAGTNYIFVATSFENGETGAYIVSVTGPGNIITGGSVIPEPSALPALILFGVAGAGIIVSRHRVVAKM